MKQVASKIACWNGSRFAKILSCKGRLTSPIISMQLENEFHTPLSSEVSYKKFLARLLSDKRPVLFTEWQFSVFEPHFGKVQVVTYVLSLLESLRLTSHYSYL